MDKLDSWSFVDMILCIRDDIYGQDYFKSKYEPTSMYTDCDMYSRGKKKAVKTCF